MERRERDARVAEIAALDQPVRADLYALLVERDGWVGRDEAAEALGLPRSVAAFHLDKLADAGLVETRFERPPGRSGPGAGRPAKKYRRVKRELTVSLPDRRYDLAGAVLADAVADAAASGRPVEEALTDTARATGRHLGEALRVELGGRSATAMRASVVRALERLGYEPHTRHGEIVMANCPFHTLAERHRGLVCGMNLDLLSGLAEGLGAEQQLAPRLEPSDGLCCVRLRAC
ncbi:MAG TPA: helix-turn-helix domain-containing protein [Acidimicrobiales bacterium]|nr:helix-turn-helix domain-containing protein [Acidimicrobiales bacterium]